MGQLILLRTALPKPLSVEPHAVHDVPQRVPSHCNCTALRQAARHVTRFYDLRLAGIGLRSTQFTILNMLSLSGPITMAELANRLVMDRATLGHNLRPLERDQLIEINVGERDRRERQVTITKPGRALEAKARPHWVLAQAEYEKLFGSVQSQQLRERLAEVSSLEFSETVG